MRASLAVLLAALTLTSACGRLAFDDVSGSGGGGGTGTGVLHTGALTSVTPVAGIEVGAQVERLLVAGTTLYVATHAAGAELALYDISNPATPTLVGTGTTDGIPYDLALAGTRLYVATATGGDDLEIFDVSDRTAPRKLGGIAAADTAFRVAVHDGRAYVTTAAAGDDLEIFDVTTASSPQKIGGLELLDVYYTRGVVVDYPLVYTAGSKMNVIDVSNPAAPVILGEGNFYWYAYDLAASGTRVVGLDSNNSNQPQLRVWDVSSPSAPIMVGMADIWDSYGRDVELVGPYALTVCAPGGYSYGAELEIWDVSGSADPVLVTSQHLEHDGIAVAVASGYIYVGEVQSDAEELRVFAAR